MFVVTGGLDSWGYDAVLLDSTEIFDPLVGSWVGSGQSGAKLPRPMCGLRAEIINGRLLFFGINIIKFIVIIPSLKHKYHNKGPNQSPTNVKSKL